MSRAETYTQEFSYNNFGGLSTLKTWRTNTTPQMTSWNYDSRQRVKEKIYADGRKVSYTYTADNQPLKRTWARGVTTTYSYDNGGRQTGIDYSDATPDVSITYDFLSRPVTVTDGAGTRTYTYDNAKNVLTAETLPYLADTTLNYTYDAYGRRTGQALNTGSTTHQQANYTYGTDGRYATVSDGGYTAHYTHNAAGQLSTLRLATASNNQTVSTATRSFDSAHRLTGVSTTAGALTKNYGYTLNIKDQRIKTTLADGSYWDYAYDNYGQVINAVRKNASGGIAGQSFNYSFDQVGNRQSAFQGTTGSDSQWSYTVNAVNQYSLITEPNGTTYAQVHDADGNLTGSYTTQYTYDAENRLKTADVGTYRYEYAYDYLSRRIRQKVILKSGATGQTQSEVAYVYDGWNVVGVYDITTATPTFQKGYLWGEDLSGSLQGAGGVGGLLAEKRGGQTYLPVYDGNGNIMSYLNASTKASVAEYVYDAFGRTVSSSGAEADNFTYRFSTKPKDGSGLYYYGYRYYDPQHGRWISRDPLEEEGGVNLYGFIQNNGVKFIDVNGLWGWDGDYIETIWIMMSDDSADGDAVREAFFMEAWDRGNATADALTFDATKALRQKLNCDIVFDEESYEKQRCFASCWERNTANVLAFGALDAKMNSPWVSNILGGKDLVDYWQDDNMLGVGGSVVVIGAGNYARIYERRSREQQEIFERLRVSARRNQHKKKQPNKRRNRARNTSKKYARQANAARLAGNAIAAGLFISDLFDCYNKCEECSDAYQNFRWFGAEDE